MTCLGSEAESVHDIRFYCPEMYDIVLFAMRSQTCGAGALARENRPRQYCVSSCTESTTQECSSVTDGSCRVPHFSRPLREVGFATVTRIGFRFRPSEPIQAGWPIFDDICLRHSHRGCPSIRTKAVSRTKISCRCFWHRFFAREVEDQDSGNGNLTLITCGGNLLQEDRSTNHRFGLNIDHDSSMRTSRPVRDARAPTQHLRSSLRRPGAASSCSRCERSLDTRLDYVASSRVVRLTCAPSPPWPRPSACDDSDANTVGVIRDRAAPPPALLPPTTNAACGCPAW